MKTDEVQVLFTDDGAIQYSVALDTKVKDVLTHSEFLGFLSKRDIRRVAHASV